MSNIETSSQKTTTPTILDFFAGSGLVTEGMRGLFETVWALDNSSKKATVYIANHGQEHFKLDSIEKIRGSEIPEADAAWASFPCQDLSLAGRMDGLEGVRSGLVWEWLRIIDEMNRRPKLLIAENVLGLVSAEGGEYYRAIHKALQIRGYKSGAVVLDAVKWLPQSRPRVFIVSVPKEFDCSRFSMPFPGWPHPASVVRVGAGLADWIWWKMPQPGQKIRRLSDLIDKTAPCDCESKTKQNLAMVPSNHQKQLLQELANGFKVAAGYKRTRNGRQVLELRFDQVAGCLRTPDGGSSRQVLVLKKEGRLVTRLLSVRETARLMGAPESYSIPGTYNDGYKAMGDAVAVPVVRHLAKSLLLPLMRALNEKN
ncbi:DNA cytosine methyltransferase [Patescibacteria group bacterium]|nr:DNA cytosine methyltransferase [Patescibacteria group bacterium]